MVKVLSVGGGEPCNVRLKCKGLENDTRGGGGGDSECPPPPPPPPPLQPALVIKPFLFLLALRVCEIYVCELQRKLLWCATFSDPPHLTFLLAAWGTFGENSYWQGDCHTTPEPQAKSLWTLAANRWNYRHCTSAGVGRVLEARRLTCRNMRLMLSAVEQICNLTLTHAMHGSSVYFGKQELLPPRTLNDTFSPLWH